MESISIDKIISPLSLSDSGKLLILFDSAKQKKISIRENYIDSYIYLINAQRIMSFNYPFRFEPLPYSPLLKEDLYGLIRTTYLSKGSNIFITSHGSKWVQQNFPKKKVVERIYNNLSNCLSEFAELGENQLFKAVYATITT